MTPLSKYEQDTLELGVTSQQGDDPGPPYVRVAVNWDEHEALARLADLGLLDIRSMTWVQGHAQAVAYLVHCTGAGRAALRAQWKTATQPIPTGGPHG